MKKMLSLAVFALGLATPAVAEDWVMLGGNVGTFIFFGDADSRTDNSAWFEKRYAKPQKLGNGKFYNTTKALLEMNCSGKRFRILTATWYSKSGKSISSSTLPYDEWYYVKPGTFTEAEYEFICNHDPR